MTKNASIYLRVSTGNQSTDSQRMEVENYCKRQDWNIYKVYEDHGISGAHADNRPALNKMLADAKDGKAGDVVVVYKIDRMARSTTDLLRILSELKTAGVDFCSTTQAIDTTNAMGKMVLTFLGAIAEFERETLVQRVKSGLANARANGVQLGRPRIGFDIGAALRMHQEGIGVRKIGKQLGVSHVTVHRYLRSVTLTQSPKQPQTRFADPVTKKEMCC
ncbi:MAG: recombinase family protein [Bacteroidia bacterium]